MDMVVKGLITGCIIVLPGMSGGTMLLLLAFMKGLCRTWPGWYCHGFLSGARAGIVLRQVLPGSCGIFFHCLCFLIGLYPSIGKGSVENTTSPPSGGQQHCSWTCRGIDII